ncbi:MAG: hypothetical protein AB2551_10940 [Candidatus Thiodiazotropha sp.]
MMLDIEEWLPYFESRDIPHEEKEELICMIWYAMKSGADQAFQRYPVQQCCGYVPSTNLQSPERSLDSKGNPVSMCFGNAANDNEYKEERSAHEHKKQG